MKCCKLKFLLLGWICLCAWGLPAQIPSACFEIEGILVDACGNPEGQNEMVMFQVGPSPLNTGALTVGYPNAMTPYSGICQSASTASFVAAVNATILGCGHVLEPVGGVLPAGAQVILISSASANPAFNSFANLNDTLYLIFDCATYTSGHFANYAAGGGTRTLTMSFNPPGGSCTETVTYDRDLLSNANGATALFSWAGVATYTNPGCQAPFIPLAPDADPARTICAGTASLTLNGSVSPAGRPFVWSGGTGSFSSTTALAPTYTLGAGDVGTFYLYLAESSSCETRRDSVAITVAPLPSFSLPPDTAFCGNFSLSIGPGISGSGYQWSTGQTSQNITVTAPGTYTLTLTNSTGCSNTDAITIGTSTLQQVGLPGDTSICAGSSLTIGPSIAGTSYTWSTGQTSQNITVSAPGTYTLEMLSNGTCLGRDTFVLGNVPLPLLALGNDTTLCPGQSLALNANPGGVNNGAAFFWSTASTAAAIQASTPGLYAVTVTHTSGCRAIDSLLLAYAPLPALDLGPDTVLCSGNGLVLNAGSGSSFVWNTGATTPNITVTTSGNYSVEVGFGTNCFVYDTIAVQVPAAPALDLGNDTLLCPGQNLLLDAGNGGQSYTWTTGATSPTITVSAAGNYGVTLTYGPGGVCTTRDSIRVQMGTSPVVSLLPGIRLCPGGSAVLDAGTGSSNYLWSTGATTSSITITSAGLYYVLGSNVCGQDSAATLVTVAPTPAAYAGADDTLCAGDSLVMATASAIGDSLIWAASSGSFSGSDPLHPTYVADPGASGLNYITLTVLDSCGTATDTLWFEVLPLPQVSVMHPDTVCDLRPVQLSYAGNASGYQWIGAGTFSDSTGSPTTFTPSAGQSGPISVSLVATGQCGVDTLDAGYFVGSGAVAAFAWAPSVVYPGTWVSFENGSQGAQGLPHWDFGDGFSAVEDGPQHQYFSAGTYFVELIVRGQGACYDTLALPLVVLQPDTLIPNVFSPNGDGINDAFDIFGATLPPAVRSFQLSIFDRWGREVFVTHTPQSGWDGRSQGREVPEGVYYYVIQMEPLTGGTLHRTGAVTLLR